MWWDIPRRSIDLRVVHALVIDSYVRMIIFQLDFCTMATLLPYSTRSVLPPCTLDSISKHIQKRSRAWMRVPPAPSWQQRVLFFQKLESCDNDKT